MLRERSEPEFVSAAHLAKRVSVSGSHTLIETLAPMKPAEMVEYVLEGEIGPMSPPVTGDEWVDTDNLMHWWIRRMAGQDSALSERMTWFWHGVLTTNADKSDSPKQIQAQLNLLRTHSLGNYRELLQAFMIDGALLNYLDGNGSAAFAPNENLARETMELFTIGRGNYTEDDVRAAARAFAGWTVDYETGEVSLSRRDSFRAPLIFLGEQRNWDTPSVVDHLCDQPATAVHVASRLWLHLVGAPLEEKAAAELGAWWQDQDLEIKPLVRMILQSEGFSASKMARVRTGIEWFCGVRAMVLGADTMAEEERLPVDTWRIQQLGQNPYDPPNVAGWPTDDRWIGASGMLARASLVHDIDFNQFFSADMTTDDILDRCAIHEVSDETYQAIEGTGPRKDGEQISPEDRLATRFRLALTSPEFNQS